MGKCLENAYEKNYDLKFLVFNFNFLFSHQSKFAFSSLKIYVNKNVTTEK